MSDFPLICVPLRYFTQKGRYFDHKPTVLTLGLIDLPTVWDKVPLVPMETIDEEHQLEDLNDLSDLEFYRDSK